MQVQPYAKMVNSHDVPKGLATGLIDSLEGGAGCSVGAWLWKRRRRSSATTPFDVRNSDDAGWGTLHDYTASYGDSRSGNTLGKVHSAPYPQVNAKSNDLER
jgi:hypothetical protein